LIARHGGEPGQDRGPAEKLGENGGTKKLFDENVSVSEEKKKQSPNYPTSAKGTVGAETIRAGKEYRQSEPRQARGLVNSERT